MHGARCTLAAGVGSELPAEDVPDGKDCDEQRGHHCQTEWLPEYLGRSGTGRAHPPACVVSKGHLQKPKKWEASVDT